MSIEKLFRQNLIEEASVKQIKEFFDSRLHRAEMLKEQNARMTLVAFRDNHYVFIVRDEYTVLLDYSWNIASCDCPDFTHRGMKLKKTRFSAFAVCKHSVYVKVYAEAYVNLQAEYLGDITREDETS